MTPAAVLVCILFLAPIGDRDAARAGGTAPDRSILRGSASWYAAPTGTAAAGPALRRALGPDWRGKIVVTCAANDPRRCVTVKLADWCQCHRGTRRERIIDLSAGSFARLAPLSRGLVRVEVR